MGLSGFSLLILLDTVGKKRPRVLERLDWGLLGYDEMRDEFLR